MLNLRGQCWAALVAVMTLILAGNVQADIVRVIYNLDGTTLELRNLPIGNDQTHAVGPGTIIVDYTSSGAIIVDGPVQLRAYSLVQKFTSSSSGVTVVADIFAEANFTGAQFTASGNLSGGVITWNQTFPYKVTGTNTCTSSPAFLCNIAGFTPGQPRDEAREDPVTFAPFRFGAGGPAAAVGFNGDELLLPGDDQADTYLLLRANESSRRSINFALSGVLRAVQLYNAGRYHCRTGTEDGYDLGPVSSGGTETCAPHPTDYQSGANFRILLSELLRTVQLFSLGGGFPCPNAQSSEDGFCGN